MENLEVRTFSKDELTHLMWLAWAWNESNLAAYINGTLRTSEPPYTFRIPAIYQYLVEKLDAINN